MDRRRPAFLRSTAVVLLVALLGGAPASVTPQIGPDTAARIDSVFADVDRPDGPGCAVGVVRDGDLAYAQGYGLANLDYRQPITKQTAFYIASLSKQFTAAAVVVAARQDLLSLDDSVRTWLPEFPRYDAGPITIRHLIHHTSGLRSYHTLAAMAGWENLDAYGADEYLDLVYRQEGLNFDPGTDSGYSNTNYLLLAKIVEAASGQTLRQFADDHLFDPLEMDHTTFYDNRNEVVRNRAVGYAKSGSAFVMRHPWDYEVVGASGVYTTVEDLATWTRNFDTETVGGDGFTEQMTTRGRLADGDTLGYAFGLRIGRYRGRRTVEHGGTLEGFRSEYLRFPDDDRTVIVLCNCPADPSARARSVADLVLPGMEASPAGGPESASAGGPDAAPEGPALDLSAYTGLYHSSSGGYVRFLVKEGRLMAGRSKAFTIPLRPVASDRFTVPGPIDAFRFSEVEDGRPQQVDVYRSTDTTSFNRIQPAAYTEAELSALAGRYHSDALDVEYRVRVEDGTLHLVPADRSPIPLSPGVADAFRLRGGYVRFTRGADGSVTGFVYNTRRVARLRFDRIR